MMICSNVFMGRDFTIHSGILGKVAFFKTKSVGRHRRLRRTYINVIPMESDGIIRLQSLCLVFSRSDLSAAGAELVAYKDKIMQEYKERLEYRRSRRGDELSRIGVLICM